MINIPTNLEAKSALEPLRELVKTSNVLSGEVSDVHFSLRLKPRHRKACPICVRGHLHCTDGQTLITVKTFPATEMIVLFILWLAFGAFAVFGFGRNPTSCSEAVGFGLFILIGAIATTVSFRSESKRAYSIIKSAYAD